MLKNIINYLVFLPGWFICIHFHDFKAALVGIALFVLNIFLTGDYKKYFLLSAVIVSLGYLSDILILSGNVYNMTGTGLDKLWLIAVWCLFSSTFSFSLKFFGRMNIILQAIIAGSIGNLTYFYALRVGAIDLTISDYKAVCVLLFTFALLLPMLFKVNESLSMIIDSAREEDANTPSVPAT